MPVPLADHIPDDTDFFLGVQFRSRVLDQEKLRVRFAVDDDVKPIICAEALRLDPFAGRERHTADTGTALNFDIAGNLSPVERRDIPAADLLFGLNGLTALVPLTDQTAIQPLTSPANHHT